MTQSQEYINDTTFIKYVRCALCIIICCITLTDCMNIWCLARKRQRIGKMRFTIFTAERRKKKGVLFFVERISSLWPDWELNEFECTIYVNLCMRCSRNVWFVFIMVLVFVHVDHSSMCTVYYIPNCILLRLWSVCCTLAMDKQFRYCFEWTCFVLSVFRVSFLFSFALSLFITFRIRLAV